MTPRAALCALAKGKVNFTEMAVRMMRNVEMLTLVPTLAYAFQPAVSLHKLDTFFVFCIFTVIFYIRLALSA